MGDTVNPLLCIQEALKKFNEQIELSIKGESSDLNKFLDSLREHNSARGIDNILLNISTRCMNKFPEECFETLRCYVYRLIDPRNGKTFYIGRGRRNHVFEHINDELKFSKS